MSLDLFFQTIYLFFLALILAVLEIQIEGGAGWAQSLPTWRPSQEKWYAKFYQRVMSKKDLTGYHLAVFGLVLGILHYPYFTGKIWNLSSELSTLSLFFIVSVVWDFLWFVLNPYYDFMNFWKKRIWWHKKWFWHMPNDYWLALIISAALYARFSLDLPLLIDWLKIISLFSILTVSTIIFAMVSGIFRGKKELKQ